MEKEKRQEIPRSLGERFEAWLTTAIVKGYLNTWELKKPARRYFDEIIADIVAGKERSFSQDSHVLLEGLDTQVWGEENIPSRGPLVVIGNHYAGGPLKAVGGTLLISAAVISQREEGEVSQEVHWVIQRGLQAFSSGVITPFTAQFSEKLAKTYGFPLVEPPVKGQRGRLPLSLFRDFPRGGIIGFYPEGTVSFELKRGLPQAGEFVELLAKICPEGNLLPCGVLRKEKSLIANFGTPLPLNNFLPKVENGVVTDYQAVADCLMGEIADLLPELRGFYAKPPEEVIPPEKNSAPMRG